MSAPGQANPSVRRARLDAKRRYISRDAPANARGAVAVGLRIGRVSAPAWVAIAATSTFVALACWWLASDRSVPIYDVGDQLQTALQYHGMLAAGNLLGPLTQANVYPILVHLVGAVAMLIGGVNVTSATIGENVVFVPLLALGVYQTGRFLYGSRAGMLAVVFVLGSPLLMSLFHVFLLDAPLTALVIVSVWLVLASEDFARVGVSAAAGLAVGLGVNIKVQFGLFLAGLILVVLAHGGWRNRRGLVAFAAVAVVVGTPWYLIHINELPRMFELASSGPGTPAGNIPPTLSIDNFSWYFWNVLNSQLLAPLFVLLLIGGVWTTVTTTRERGASAARLEFLLGTCAAWLAITLTPHHDIRYGLPLLGFLAVMSTGWIVRLPRNWSLAVSAVLVLVVVANTLGMTFGVGREVKLALAHPLSQSEQKPGRIVLYATNGFLVSAPSRDGDVPGLLRDLHREGVATLDVPAVQSELPDFSYEGLLPLARMVGIDPVLSEQAEYAGAANVATLVHEPVRARRQPPCTRLSDGTGVWVARYDARAGKLALYCPVRRPRYYAVGALRQAG